MLNCRYQTLRNTKGRITCFMCGADGVVSRVVRGEVGERKLNISRPSKVWRWGPGDRSGFRTWHSEHRSQAATLTQEVFSRRFALSPHDGSVCIFLGRRHRRMPGLQNVHPRTAATYSLWGGANSWCVCRPPTNTSLPASCTNSLRTAAIFFRVCLWSRNAKRSGSTCRR